MNMTNAMNAMNTMNSNILHPCVIEPARIVDEQKPTLIDNIFVNLFNKDLKSGNLVEKVSDHLPNFIIIKKINKKISKQKIKVDIFLVSIRTNTLRT